MSDPGRRRPARIRTVVRAGGALLIAAALPAVALPAATTPLDVPVDGSEHAAPAVMGHAVPTDLIRDRQWHLKAMRAPAAWRWSKGKGVTVAVLDTGVNGRHPDLTGRVSAGPDYTGSARRPGGRFWGVHGTSMASVIAGHGHGPGLSAGVMGIAPQARILSIRVTWENDDPVRRQGEQVNADRDAVAKGIRYAVDNGADIINMSLGGGKQFYNGNATEESAVRYAIDKGVVLVASAGNDGSGLNRRNFPAAYSGVIAVGALDTRLQVWKDTNRHEYVKVCTPGVEIVSADAATGYQIGTGTSPSSALAAGVAALVKSRYPDLTPAEVQTALERGVRRPVRTAFTGDPCVGPLDAVRAIAAANRINKENNGRAAVRTEQPAEPQTTEALPEKSSDLLLYGILGGGALLVLSGLVLGWRQRHADGAAANEAAGDETARMLEPAGAVSGGPATDTKVAPLDGSTRYPDSEPAGSMGAASLAEEVRGLRGGLTDDSLEFGASADDPAAQPAEDGWESLRHTWLDEPTGELGAAVRPPDDDRYANSPADAYGEPPAAGVDADMATQAFRAVPQEPAPRFPDLSGFPDLPTFSENAAAGLSEDDLPTSAFSSVPPRGGAHRAPGQAPNDPGPAETKPDPLDEDDFRPPWA